MPINRIFKCVVFPALLGVAVWGWLDSIAFGAATAQKPNVIIVLADDQGYGDLSCHGNPLVRTPCLDKLHSQSVRFTDFHVAPICTPTRSQLLTGRDALANGAYAVCSGHCNVRADLPTAADLFAKGGYRTGLFGKWHLGDSYPYRPQDRGFQETLTFRGYGPISMLAYWNSSLFDDKYLHNGVYQQYQGYSTDVWFSEAMRWMKSRAEQREPFFVYLAPCSPHWPLWVPEKYIEPYKGKVPTQGIKPKDWKVLDYPLGRFFGKIACIDENMGRMDAMLKQAGLYDNTILIYMTDNGSTMGAPQFYNAGMRGEKGEYYDGGHRAPCFMRWPAGNLRAPGDVGMPTQVQDILPTLLDLCGLPRPDGTAFDGVSLANELRGKPQLELTGRKFVVQCALWDEYLGPNKWKGAVIWNHWRLVAGKELYNIKYDPAQVNDVADQHPDVLAAMRDHYEQWWAKMEPVARKYPPFHLGSARENPVLLGAQDWVGPNTADTTSVRFGQNKNGPWHVHVERDGIYTISLRRWPAETGAAITAGVPAFHGVLGDFPAGVALPITRARLRIGDHDETKPVTVDDKEITFKLHLTAGETLLQTWFYNQAGEPLCGAYYVSCQKVQ